MIFNGFYLINLQALHQWRFMHDEEYQLEYFEFLEELGLSMEILMDERLLVVPTEEGIEGVIFGNQGSSEA